MEGNLRRGVYASLYALQDEVRGYLRTMYTIVYTGFFFDIFITA